MWYVVYKFLWLASTFTNNYFVLVWPLFFLVSWIYSQCCLKSIFFYELRCICMINFFIGNVASWAEENKMFYLVLSHVSWAELACYYTLLVLYAFTEFYCFFGILLHGFLHLFHAWRLIDFSFYIIHCSILC